MPDTLSLPIPNLRIHEPARPDNNVYVSCKACHWGNWYKETDTAATAGVEHLESHHPPVDDQENSELLRRLVDALTPRCCHISGEHDPLHWREGRYICASQMAAAWHRAVRLLNLQHLDSPTSAEADPDTCYWCHHADQQRHEQEATEGDRGGYPQWP